MNQSRDDLPLRPQTQLSKKALRVERRKKLREQRKLVQKITKRLYEIKHPPLDIAEHREVQTQVLNLRQITRQVKRQQSESGLSTIQNMSQSMIDDIKGARMGRDTFEFTEGEEELSQLDQRHNSVQYLPSRKSHTSTGTSGNQLRVLTSKMEQLVHSNSMELAEVQRKIEERKKNTRITGSFGMMISKGLTRVRPVIPLSATFPREDAELVRLQLRRDIKRLETKIRLLVSSVLILEDDIKACASESCADKRKVLQKRVNSIYALMDFLKQTKKLAAEYVQQIEEVLFADEDTHIGEKIAQLIHDIEEMVKAGKAIDFVTSKIEVRNRGDITKKELVKYKQVTLPKVLPAILTAASKQ